MQSIIIDTDIGYDIADTWALNLMLSTNLFDVKLISVTHGDIDYQVALVAKILKLLNKEYIPIVRGVGNLNNQYPQKRWLEDFDLKELNNRIGYIPQTAVMFTGSVEENSDNGQSNT